MKTAGIIWHLLGVVWGVRAVGEFRLRGRYAEHAKKKIREDRQGEWDILCRKMGGCDLAFGLVFLIMGSACILDGFSLLPAENIITPVMALGIIVCLGILFARLLMWDDYTHKK